MDGITVTAIVPMYKGQETLSGALQSLCEQDIDGLEILALDDGSPDKCSEIVENICKVNRDDRLILHRHENRGLAGTLNRGIELARGRYIARQDQDDLLLPGRLARQREFLDNNPDVAMVGTWAQIYVGDVATERYHRHPTANDALRLHLLFDNPFVHSSMMIRTDVLRELGGYSEDKTRQPPEDYELWSRIARKYRMANLPEVLTIYREVPNSMSRITVNPFAPMVLKIAGENLHFLLRPKYSVEACMGLARLLHRMEGANEQLSRSQALTMLRQAAMRICGGDAPSQEFSDLLAQLRSSIEIQFHHQRLSTKLREAARWLRAKLIK